MNRIYTFVVFTFVLCTIGLAQDKPLPIKPFAVYNPTFEQANGEWENGESVIGLDGSLYAISQTRNALIVTRSNSTLSSNAWSYQFPNTGGNVGITQPFLSTNGNVNFVFHHFSWNNLDFDPGPGTALFSPRGDLMWLQFNPNGTLVFARKLTETLAIGEYSFAAGCTSDAEGNLYVMNVLYQGSSRDYDPGAGQTTFTAGFADLPVLAKYTNSGALVWARQMPFHGGYTRTRMVKWYGQHLYIGGKTASGPVVGKYTLDGTEVAVVSVGGSVHQFGSFAVDPDEQVIAAHSVYSTQSGQSSAYLSRFSSALALVSRTQVAEVPNLDLSAVAVEPITRDVLVGGWVGPYSLQLYSGGQPLGTRFHTEYNKGLVFRFSASGTLRGTYFYGGTGSNNGNQVLGIDFTIDGKPVISGRYTQNADLDPSPIGQYMINGTPVGVSTHWFVAYFCETLPAPTEVVWTPYLQAGGSAGKFEVAPVTEATGYTWSTIPELTLQTGANTNAVTIAASAAGVTSIVRVTADNGCGRGLPYERTVRVGATTPATINVADVTATYGDQSIILAATTNSPQPISYSVIDQSQNAVLLSGNVVKINRPGTVRMMARVASHGGVLEESSREFKITVAKKNLRAVADNKSKAQGADVPPLTFTYDNANAIRGNALHVDGSDDLVSIPNPTALKNAHNELSVEAWVKLPNLGVENKIIGNMSSNTGFLFGVTLGGQLFPEVWTEQGINRYLTAGVVPIDTWTHIAFTYKRGGQLIAYINGQEVGRQNVGDFAPRPSPSATMLIGQYFTFSEPGTYDEIRVWTKERTATEIRNDMNKTIAATDPNLIAYYTFDQGIAGGANAAVNRLIDEKGNHGVMAGFALNGATSNWVEGKIHPALDIDTPPVAATTATKDAPVGEYDITLTGGTDDKYALQLVNGKLTVLKKAAVITLNNKQVVYNGTSHSVEVTTEPANLSVTVTYNGQAALPMLPGVYQVEAVVNSDEFQGTATAMLTIAKATATLALSGLDRVYSGSPQQVTATTTPADLQVAVTYNGRTEVPVLPGTYQVAAAIVDNLYEGIASGTLTIRKRPQELTASELAENWVVDESVTLEVSSSSGLPVTLRSSNAAVASVTGNRISFLSEGSADIRLTQAGTNLDEPAEKLIRTVQVSKRTQVITFANPGDRSLADGGFQVTASSTSGLAVQFSAVPADRVRIFNNTITPLQAGKVTLTARQPGSTTFLAAAEVSQEFCLLPRKPLITVSEEDNGAPLLTSSAEAHNQWLVNGSEISGATAKTYRVDRPGRYQVRVAIEGCGATSDEVLMLVTGVENENRSLQIFPNPVSDVLHIALGASTQHVRIFNTLGSLVFETEATGDLQVNVGEWAAGVYTLSVHTATGIVNSRFVKK